jgi:hypothetical protein
MNTLAFRHSSRSRALKENFLQHHFVQRQIGDEPFEFGIFFAQLAHLAQLLVEQMDILFIAGSVFRRETPRT